MNLKKPVNENYAAVVTTIRAINKLDNCDNVVAVPIFGYQAIVSKDTQVGDLVLVFTAETQLSDEYTKANNLYRDSTLNVDPTAKGYIESNRRVKAVKFRGHRSDALVMPIRSLEFTGVDVSELKDGDVFDELAGVSICKKYEVVKKNGTAKTSFKEEKFKRIDNKFFPEHYSTAHWFRQMDHIPDDAQLVITQKAHGCFTSKTLVTMANGSKKKISDIVIGDYVLGMDDNGNLGPTKVVNVAVTGKTDKWLQCHFKNNTLGDQYISTTSTHDHKFYTKNRGWISAAELVSEDIVYHYSHEEFICENRRQLLEGMLLGDGCVNFYKSRNQHHSWSIAWCHKEPHREYMQWLQDSLGDLVRNKTIDRQTNSLGIPTLRNWTGTMVGIKKISERFYRNGKKCIPENFEFTPISLAVWFMDDGSRAHNSKQKDRANFAICRYDDVDIKHLNVALLKFGFTNPRFYRDPKGYNRLRLNYKDAELLFKSIRHLVPEVMQYKLPEYHRGFFVGAIEHEDSVCFLPVETNLVSSKEVSSIDIGYSSKYDIETETHNFFANKVLVHNSSIRIGHVPVRRELNWKEKIAKFFGVKVAETEYDHVYGSRRVIKDVNNPNQEHFYKDDVWTAAGKKLDSMIPQNFILYGEILGWTEDGSPLQSGYTYNLPQKQSEFYVYRILVLTNDGRHIELSWEAVKRFCKDNGIKYVPELFVGTKKDIVENGIIESLMDIRYYDEYKAGRIPFNEEPVPLSDKGTVDEGVCIRVVECEAVHPTILKAKAPMFLAYETKQLDAEVVDLESDN